MSVENELLMQKCLERLAVGQIVAGIALLFFAAILIIKIFLK